MNIPTLTALARRSLRKAALSENPLIRHPKELDPDKASPRVRTQPGGGRPNLTQDMQALMTPPQHSWQERLKSRQNDPSERCQKFSFAFSYGILRKYEVRKLWICAAEIYMEESRFLKLFALSKEVFFKYVSLNVSIDPNGDISFFKNTLTYNSMSASFWCYLQSTSRGLTFLSRRTRTRCHGILR